MEKYIGIITPFLSSLAESVTERDSVIWSHNHHSGCVQERAKRRNRERRKERKRGKEKEKHLLFQHKRAVWWEQRPQSACGSSQGAEAFIRASLTEAIWRAYGRFTVFSEGPAGAPWERLNWEMSESGRRIEQCFVSEGEDSLAHQRRSHKARSHRNSDTNLLTQWHTYSRWAWAHKPHKDRSKFVCRVPISISRF